MERLNQKQTKDQIADTLRSAIVSGAIADGTELAQEQLASQLEVSRMPVREALQLLSQEGFLRRLPNRHMQVVGLTPNTIAQNMSLVAAVEIEAAIAALGEENHNLSKLNCADDRSFHEGISGNLTNLYLRQTHQRLLAGYPSYVWETCKIGQFSKENEAICAAFSSEREVLSRKIRSYYDTLGQWLIHHLQERREAP